jgi:uncharacterized protein YbdZ (MbtH family)
MSPQGSGESGCGTWTSRDGPSAHESADGLPPEELALLYMVNGWCLMNLADARAAAVRFLESRTSVLAAPARTTLERALEFYRHEATLTEGFCAANARFIIWRGGSSEPRGWTAEARKSQSTMLSEAMRLEQRALLDLEEVLGREAWR